MPVAAVRRLSRASAMGVVLLLTLGLAATGSSNASLTSTTASTARGTLTPKALVRHIALVNSDFTDGRSVSLLQQGNRVQGEVTLDNCGFNFTTEANRVARHQTEIVPAPGKSWTSNEVVAYETPHFAAKALRQFRKSVMNCPKGVFTPSGIVGVPDLRYDVSKIRSSAKLPVTDNAVIRLKITVKGVSKPFWSVLIFQRQGTVLDGVYRASFKKPTAAKMADLRSLATITGQRLAAS
jgi:hypothetical protein